MIQENRFYCLSCSTVQPAKKSGRLFRTGYYRCTMRLGYCLDCLSQNQAAGVAGIAHVPPVSAGTDGAEEAGHYMFPDLP